MLTFHSLGVEEARAAISAGVAKAKENSVLMAFAVTDRAGDLIMCERMDGAPFRNLRHAMRKAYTSAIMGRDTVLFAQQLRERNGDLVQWGDAQLTTLSHAAARREKWMSRWPRPWSPRPSACDANSRQSPLGRLTYAINMWRHINMRSC